MQTNQVQLVAFLYTNAKRGIKKTIPFTIASETMKYLGIIGAISCIFIH